jgi:hypothetical protein
MGFTHNDRQIQLHGFGDLALLAPGNVSANRLCHALYRFGGHFQAGQDFHLLATVIQGRLLAHHGLHAAYTGGELRILDV